MRLLEKAADLLGEEDPQGISFLWHLLGPLFVLLAYSLASQDPLLLGVGIFGLLLSARWQVRGFCYALVALAVLAIGEHGFFTQHHLWQLGVEGIYAIAFFITALTAEQREKELQALFGLVDMRGDSLSNLEEEMGKTQEAATALQIALQEKNGALQKELEEAQGEHRSLLVLNEVLRKTGAIHIEEKKALKEDLFDLERKIAFLQEELTQAQGEQTRLANASDLAIENRELLTCLNSARFEKEQARLISEALAREHAKESARVKELTGRLLAMQEEHQRLAVQPIAEGMLQPASSERAARRNPGPSGLGQASYLMSSEKELFAPIRSGESPSLQEGVLPELEHLRQKVAELVKIEPLYKQLKGQFEEKNEVLHQTRASLFRADIALQALQMEKEQRELFQDPLTSAMAGEMVVMEEALSQLEGENQELENLVTFLSENSLDDAARRKKKVKMHSEQSLLF